jgi:SAM-dependent methyltransferase
MPSPGRHPSISFPCEREVDPAASSFEAMVDEFVRAAIQQAAPDCFDDLVVNLPGVYPTDALSAVERLEQYGELDAVTLARLRRRGSIGQPPPTAHNPLPVPHPLDFDWRFSTGAVQRLVSECRSRSGDTRPILLGAPSVFWALRESKSTPALLLDANPAVIDVLAGGDGHDARLCDLRCDDLPDEQSAVVVVDPPWYREHERLFLWAAARLCRPGGTVLVSVPAVGTRPGVRADREEAFAWAERLGFEVDAIEAGELGYVSPPFERNALVAVGLSGMPYEWRNGDLVVMRLRERRIVTRPATAVGTRWPEVVIGSVRLRIRPAGSGGSDHVVDPRLRAVVPGDVLDSVSRRDPRREKVDLWTSGNRVFGVRSVEALIAIIQSQAAGGGPLDRVAVDLGRRLTSVERRNIRAALTQLSAVVDVEHAELLAMGWAA